MNKAKLAKNSRKIKSQRQTQKPPTKNSPKSKQKKLTSHKENT